MRRLALILAGPLLAAPAWAECRVAVDIGHSRTAPGAVSARGVPEYSFNAALAQDVAAALRAASIPVVVINPEGAAIELKQRPKAAAAAGASLLLSLHHDSVQPVYLSSWQWQGKPQRYSDRFSGFGLFVSRKTSAWDESLLVAEAIGDGLIAAGLQPSLHHAEAIAGENRPLLDAGRGIYQFDGLAVLRLATMPAVLIEGGIIVNRTDEPMIASPSYRAHLAAAIVAAARAHCRRIE
ncbi:hypothetical protein A6A04_03570 [Paramagnetospirillum marisnigri]|uniref:N-acetylmuramoyl-L-alanine amidase n=1 Tax=Paramagnetospirillum marisnigri TaxID=1285242 RepID=A0A178MM98_9PROT|nr:N-acetylmuramoyl-L-alanine amidase [Paramagnetospirillum marisnigri]OAN49205.1 hypothetical protein A6A04_03570 [Paramagnetospirillum marisnigri]